MESSQADLYWQMQSTQDTRDPMAGFMGYSPSPSASASSSSNGPRSGSNDSGHNSSNGAGSATGMGRTNSYGLSPSAMDPNTFSGQFTTPRFATGGQSDPYGFGVAVVDAQSVDTSKSPSFAPSPHQQAFYPHQYAPPHTMSSAPPRQQSNSNGSSVASTSARPYSTTAAYAPYNASAGTNPPPPASSPQQQTTGGNNNGASSGPIYAPYGSSVISVNSTSPSTYKLSPFASMPTSSTPSTTQFDPAALGLPVPPPSASVNNFAGLYSSSGFDILGVLARVAARPNPQLAIGAVDTSCAFLVVDAKKWDMPIVFASDTFTKLTGYANEEILGRNCRFLQTPDGSTQQGLPRQYTDGNAAWHMRTHISSGKESQSSLINYKKGGVPFINLVTIVPITWDSDEIAYYVGFQVDLVDQPNSILDRMRDGSYIVNYTLYSQNNSNPTSSNPGTVSMKSIENDGANVKEAAAAAAAVVATDESSWMAVDEPSTQTGLGNGDTIEMNDAELLDVVQGEGVEALQGDANKRAFHKLLLAQADDFIHVLSLKGSLLYCSPSVSSVLEYQPNELIGKTLPMLCHPSDVVPVMRLLKDCSSISHPTVSLLYRVQRKHSGYIWLAASGKLHIEPGKGRKCVILVGRPTAVDQMSWGDLRQAGGVGDTEFWMKLSGSGTILTSTQSVQHVLGISSQDLTGASLHKLAQSDHADAITKALRQCEQGNASTVQYRIKSTRNKSGFADVVTRFYPRQIETIGGYSVPPVGSAHHVNIIAQTNEVFSEERKSSGPFAAVAPSYSSNGSGGAATGSPADSESSSGSSAPVFQSTFKQLAHPSTVNDNVFDELESRRPTSWQFELHQLENTNKKLREEKEHLVALARKRGHPFLPGTFDQRPRRKTSSDAGSTSSKSNGGRGCANCGRFDSPEWRAGPTGAKTLCNRCGLRWAKTNKQSNGTGSGGQSPSLASVSDAGEYSSMMAPDVKPSPSEKWGAGVDGA